MNNLSVAQLAGLALLAIGCSSGDPADAVVPEAVIPEGVTIVVDGTAQPTYTKGLVNYAPDFGGAAGGYAGSYTESGGEVPFSATDLYGFAVETEMPSGSFPAAEGANVFFGATATGSYSSATANVGITLRFGEALYIDNGDVALYVTEYGEIGGRIKGSFTATLFADIDDDLTLDDGETTMSVAGTFDVPRLDDYSQPIY